MSAWSVLPNAAHIDRILESLKTHPEVWDDWDATVDAAWAAAWNAACKAASAAKARAAAWNAACEAASAARARAAAWPSITALIAWDDSSQFLKMTEDALEVWIRISDDPHAILLLPAVRVFERIKELEAA